MIVDVFGLPSDAKGLVTVEIYGISNCSDVINGMATIIVPQRLPNGTYTVTITYSGDDRYNMVKSDENVSVNKLSVEMRVIADNIDVGKNLTIQIELPSNITGEFAYISINGTEIQIMINNGKAVCSISNLTKGTYPYTVSYGGNDRYESDEYSNNVEVGKIAIDYNAAVKDITYGESAVVSISNLPNDASGNVTVVINKNEYFSKVSGSTISINIPGLNAGQQTAEVRYSDEKYMANSKYISFNVKKADPEITIEADDIRVGEDLKVIISLPKDVSGNVIVNVGEISKTVNLIDGC